MPSNSYFAGLGLSFNEAQALNGLAWAASGASCYLIWPGSKHIRRVEREGGRRIELPPAIRGKAQVLTAAHTLGMLGPAAAFFFSLPLNRFVIPGWLLKFALPPAPSPMIYYGSRIAGCIASIGVGVVTVWGLNHLGGQWNYLGVSHPPLSSADSSLQAPKRLNLGSRASQGYQVWSIRYRAPPNV
jgi:hypothetical protein